MKKTFNLTILLGLIILGFNISSCNDDEGIIVNNVILTDAETSELTYMLEEEKLARDVYHYLGSKYNINIFENIAFSEQRHMDYLLDLFNEYDLDSPPVDEPGAFSNNELQNLYNSLISEGDRSLFDALFSGSTIEDKDIKDLNYAISNTNKHDVIKVYEILLCGSKNHLRAIIDQINKEGSNYIPQYISQEMFNDIISGDHESCHE